MFIKKKNIIGMLLFLFSFLGAVFAADIRFEATVDRTKVSLGSSLQLNLSFYGVQNVPAPRIGNIEGFDVRYLGPSTRVSIVNGEMSTSITHIYTLVPLKTGRFKIGPFTVTYKGEKFTSQPINVEVVSSPLSHRRSLSQQSEQLNSEELQDRIFLTMEAGKSEIYLNEVVPLTIKLYVNNLAARDIQYPEFEHEGFSVEKFGQPRQYRESYGGVVYNVIEFHTNIFPVKPGKLTLGPARLNCKLVVKKQPRRKRHSFDDFFSDFFNDNDIFGDFFGRYETYPLTVSSPQLSLTVLPFPREDKPPDFKGAVGDFSLEVEVSPKEVKAGDPITLTMTIKGKGNFDTVSLPALHSKEGFKVYEPEVNQQKFEKVFKEVVIPLSEKVTSVPEVSFSFFNPYTRTYHTLTRGPFPVTVKKAEGGAIKIVEKPSSAQTPLLKEHLGRDIVYIKETMPKFRRIGGYLYKKKAFWLLQLLALIGFIILLISYKHSERLRTDIRYARRLSAPRKAKRGIKEAQELLRQGKTKEFFDITFKTLREYLGDKFHLPAAGITVDVVEQILKPKGVDERILKRVRGIFEDCDLVRYAPSEFDRTRMEKIFRDVQEVIDYFEREK
jgi:hypothetical protein